MVIATVYWIMRLRRSSAGDAGSVVMDCWVFMSWTLRGPHGPHTLKLKSFPADSKLVRMTFAEPTIRTVLITGGNRGIGLAIAEEFVAQGHRVAVTARSGEGPAGSLTVRADVTDAASLDAAFTEVEAAYGPVEVVVANAGITRDLLLMRMNENDFTDVIDTNLTGAFRVVKRASKGMMKARFGRIILVSSVSGLLGAAGQINYSASKSGLIGLARSVTRELGSRGITANVVAPGLIETEMTAVLSDEVQADYKKSIPAGRFASPQEVAKVIAWLASDDAAYISGAIIPVDGGLGMGH
ncbi:beta-ketoacyl-ACP reductase [Conyzicola nivalis]|uniref:Beta-ketoacyl-ACP reductase n=2 Tax=Conyzicola nivalis TaxID=1477021 RepID=A0A916SDZ5_9MICO|nr:beta-ketoacyl-ACP reductase [Conyzicola nivalis]